MNRQAYTAFLVEDIAEVQADVDVRAMYAGKSTYSLYAYIEGDSTNGLASLPSSFGQLQGTLGSDLIDDDFIRGNQYLDDADVPEDGRFLYVAPGTYASILKIDKFTRQNYVGQADAQNAVQRAKVGMIYNAPVYKSTFVSNNPNVAGQAYNWMSHQRGVALIIQRQPTIHSDYILLETGWGVLVDVIYQFATRLIAPKTLGGGTSNDHFNVGMRGVG